MKGWSKAPFACTAFRNRSFVCHSASKPPWTHTWYTTTANIFNIVSFKQTNTYKKEQKKQHTKPKQHNLYNYPDVVLWRILCIHQILAWHDILCPRESMDAMTSIRYPPSSMEKGLYSNTCTTCTVWLCIRLATQHHLVVMVMYHRKQTWALKQSDESTRQASLQRLISNKCCKQYVSWVS